MILHRIQSRGLVGSLAPGRLGWLVLTAGAIVGSAVGLVSASEPAPFYRAYRDPEADLNLAPEAKISASSAWMREGTRLVPEALVDRSFNNESVWAADPAQMGKRWVQFVFREPRQLRAARLYWLPGRWGMGKRFPAFRLLAQRENQDWVEVFASASDHGSDWVNGTIYTGRTVEFPPTTAVRWRIETAREGVPLALREIELFDDLPPFRTRDQEPGDTRIRLRKRQEPSVAVRSGGAVLWAAGSMEKVFRDDQLGERSGSSKGPVVLHAARGETEAFQAVYWHPQGANEVGVRSVNLQGPTPGADQWVTVNPVAYIYCRVASTDLRMTVQGLGRFHGPGFYPEVLRMPGRVSVPPGKHQPFWVSVAVPPQARAGIYRGSVDVGSERGVMTLPFEVRVWDFDLPAAPDFAVRNVFTFLGYDEQARAAHCPDEASATAYWRNVNRAAANLPGACLSSLEPAPVSRGGNDELSYNWAPFDRQVEWCRQELGVRHFTLPFGYLAYHEAILSAAKVIGPGVPPGSERWFTLLECALEQYVTHLRARGWLSEFSFFVYDEPDNAILPACRRLVELARRVEPTLPLILHSHPWTPEMIALNSTVVLNPRNYHGPFVQRLQERGWTVWTYCNGASLIDGPPNAGRMIPWTYFKHGITGMTWHSLDDWRGTSPWEAPDRYISWNASSCFLFPDPDDPRRALRTIRWEQWRDGMEDYEYLRLLRTRAETAQDAGLRREAAQLLNRAMAAAGHYGHAGALSDEQVFAASWRPRSALSAALRAELPAVEPRIAYEEQPEIIEGLRREMGALIERMGR